MVAAHNVHLVHIFVQLGQNLLHAHLVGVGVPLLLGEVAERAGEDADVGGFIWRLNTKKTLSPHSLCLAKSAIRPREITSLVWRQVIPSSKEMRSPSRTFSQMGASDWSLKRISGETAAVAMLSDPFLTGLDVSQML